MTVEIYTDGACSGNGSYNSLGGWAAVIRLVDRDGTVVREKMISGFVKGTTNNTMELTAILEGLLALNEKCAGRYRVNVYTDSKYCIGCLEKWTPIWEKNGYRTVQGRPVANRTLIQRIVALKRKYNAKLHWVKGHTGHELNELVDSLSKRAIKNGGRNRKSNLKFNI